MLMIFVWLVLGPLLVIAVCLIWLALLRWSIKTVLGVG
jgi:hypothetical protein